MKILKASNKRWKKIAALTGSGLAEAPCRSTQLLQSILALLTINLMWILTGAWATNTKTPIALLSFLTQDPIKTQSNPTTLLILMSNSDSWLEKANSIDNCNGKRKKALGLQFVVNRKQSSITLTCSSSSLKIVLQKFYLSGQFLSITQISRSTISSITLERCAV